MLFSVTRNHLEPPNPYWSYQDVGVFFLILVLLGLILRLFVRFHLLPRSEVTNPSGLLQFAVVVSLSVGLYLVLKLRHHQPVLRPLGWIWPRTAHIVIAVISGILLASGVDLYLRFRHQSTPRVPMVELLVLGFALGPILEESFFRGCLLPLLAHSTGDIAAVILTALLFALFHQPADFAHWVAFTATGAAYGWIRVVSRSTMAATLMHATYNLALFLSGRV
ncbi:MAG: CPBP family intramembrane glutamic endopeptidase [Candidatus Korobacteraceae bacterium]